MRRRKVLEKSVRSVIESLESRTLLSGSVLVVGTGTASITGVIYNDANSDGHLNNGEAGIPGATVFLDSNNNGRLDSNEPSLTTDVNGNFSFSSIAAGQYNVVIAPQAGLVQVPPAYAVSLHNGAAAVVQIGEVPNLVANPNFSQGASGFTSFLQNSPTDTGPGTYTVAANPVDFNSTAASFGDHTTGTGQMQIIDGSSVANTVDWQETLAVTPNTTYTFTGFAASWADGATGVDPAPANLQIFVDTLAQGSLALSATDGAFTQFTVQFTTGPTQTSTVLQVADANTASHFVLDDFAVVTAVNTTGTVNGVVFNDVNQSGLYDPTTEDFLAGDTVFLDLNGNGLLDAGEPSTATNNVGFYSFTETVGSYEVVVIPRSGFHQDPPGFAQVQLTAGDQTLVNIGENNRTTISGTVYEDLNGNGTEDAGETGVAGETVFIDENFDGVLEPGTYNPSTGQWDPSQAGGGSEPFATTDANGNFTLTGFDPGEYRLVIQSAQGLIQDNPGYIDVIVNQGQNFIQNLGEGQPASIAGTVFDDKNANGVQDPGEMGLINQSVFADTNDNGVFDLNGVDANGRPQLTEPSTLTDASGAYSLSNLGPGTYTVRVVTPPGAQTTAPLNAGHSFTVTLASGENVTADNFGLKTADLTISVLKYSTAPSLTNVPRHATVRITNVGSLPANGLIGFTLYASTTTPLDTSTATIVAIMAGKKTHLAPGQSRVFTIGFKYPTQLPLNSYFITAQVNSSVDDNDSANDLAPSIGPVQIGPPYIDLSLKYAAQPPLFVMPATSSVLSLLVSNSGNVATTGSMTLQIYTSSTDQLEPNESVAASVIVPGGGIKPGHSKLVRLTLPYPGPALGNRYVIVAVVTGDPLGELNTGNNVALPVALTFFQ